MSNSQEDPRVRIDDDQLPEDLLPGEDNPLAEGLEPGETVDDLMEGGKRADESEPPEDADAASGDEPDSR